MKTVPAQDLKPGQQIMTSSGHVSTVTEPSVVRESIVEVICEDGTALAGLPCDVRVVE